MIVLDASAAIELLLRRPAAAEIEALLFGQGETLHAPHLLDIEVTQVIRRFAAGHEIDDQRGRAVLADLCDLPVQRYQHDILLLRMWGLRHNLTAYDAAYVALAEALGAVLVTLDRRLAVAASKIVRIAVV